MFKRLLDNTDANSLANRFRRNRFRYFREFIADIPLPVTILDAGGTEDFWVQMGAKDNPDLDITILNLNEPKYSQNGNLRFVKGDVTDLSEFADKSFDVVFSNSVIEHIPKSRDRQKMANEIRRVGRRSFVQTPNYYFPFEPHFLFPCFQFFPEALKLFLLQKFNMGWFKKCENRKQAQKLLEENSLLNLHEFREYFNRSRIIKEKFLFLSKSYIAVNT